MSELKDKEAASVNVSRDGPQQQSPVTGKSARKMYYDVKKELDVARIEHLMKHVSPASNVEVPNDAASSSVNSQSKMKNDKTEMRRLLETMKKSARAGSGITGGATSNKHNRNSTVRAVATEYSAASPHGLSTEHQHQINSRRSAMSNKNRGKPGA